MAIYYPSWQFWTIFGFTLFIVVLKLIVVIYLTIKIREKQKNDKTAGLDFIKGVRGFILSIFIARIFYMIFDFYYTRFDKSLYSDLPNIWYWKMGMLISSIGMAYIIMITDKKILNNKFKGIFGYIIAAGGFISLAWPVNNLDDFNTISLFSIIPMLGVILIPVIFIGIARNSSGELKKVSVIMIFAMLFYGIAAIIVNSAIIDYLIDHFNRDMDVYLYLVRAILKSIGICLFAYSATKFRT